MGVVRRAGLAVPGPRGGVMADGWTRATGTNMIDFPVHSNPTPSDSLMDETGRRPNTAESATSTPTGLGPIDRSRDPNP